MSGASAAGRAARIASIVLLTCMAYASALRGSWQFDDEHVVVANPTVREPGEALGRIGSSTRSLVHATFAINYYFGRLDPFGYHLVNVLIHAAAALALYGWLRSVPSVRGPAPALSRGPAPGLSGGLAWAAALLFAVHPLATQSVAYVAQRYSSMAGLFFFSSLWAWSLYRASGARRWYALSLLAALAGMLCKEMAAAIPLTLLAADWSLHVDEHRGRVSRLRRVVEYAPLAALLAVVPVLNLFNRDMPIEQFARSLNWAGGTDLTPWTYFLSQWGVLVFIYLRLMLWPVGLSVQHTAVKVEWPPDFWTFAAAAILAIMLVSSLVAALRAASGHVRLASFGGLLFFLGLGATSSVIPNSELVQEQRAYVSLAGIVLAVCALTWPLLTQRVHLRNALVLALAAVLAWGTSQRSAVWRSPESLWRDAVTKAPHSPRAHINLGLALAEQGRVDDAIAHYRRALELDPRQVSALNNLGNAYFQRGRMEEAARQYARAVQIAPDYPEALNNLGAALEKLGRLDQAVACCREALRLRPGYADALNNLANALRAAGRAAEAVPHYQKAIALYQRFDRPGDQARACNNLANALADLGRLEEALPYYAEALRLSPEYVNAMTNRAHVLRAAGRGDEADAVLKQARRISQASASSQAAVLE